MIKMSWHWADSDDLLNSTAIFRKLANMTKLHMQCGGLTGPISREIGQLTKLEEL